MPMGQRTPRRRSVRLRLTAGYGLMFVVSGAVLLAIASGLVVSGSTVEVPAANQPGMTPLQLAQLRIQELQHQLAAQNAVRPDLAHLLLSGSLIALSIMTAASLVVGWVVAGRVLRPLQDITAATRRISADSLHERLAMPGPGDELKDLADTIDGLLERLEGAFAAQRRFVANASHELRTPLTTMRACLDVARGQAGARCRRRRSPWPAGCAPNWTRSTGCWRASWSWPAPSTASCPATTLVALGASCPPRWPPGPAPSPPGT